MPHLSRRLLRKAIALLAEELSTEMRERWIEEIEADFASYQGRPVGELVFALRLRLSGARKLARQVRGDTVAVAKKPSPRREEIVAAANETFETRLRGRVAYELSQLNLKDLASVAREAKGISLEQAGTGARMGGQRHRDWRRSLEEQLISDGPTLVKVLGALPDRHWGEEL